MSNVDQVVSVDISAVGAVPSVPGTSIGAFAGYHTAWTDLIRTYQDASDMLADGFTTNSPLYLMALAWCSQNPHPSQFKIIRLTGDYQQVLHFTVTDTQAGHIVGLVLTDASGVTHSIQHTNTSGQTAAQIATALAALTASGATIAVDGSINTQVNITITTHHNLWYPSSVSGGTFEDVTAAPATNDIATDLAAAALVDGDFYGVATPFMSDAAIQAVAIWAEANGRFHSYGTPNTNNVDTSNLGIFQTCETAGYERTIGAFTGTPRTYIGVAAMSQLLVADPGSTTLDAKTMAAVPVDALTSTQIHNAGQFVDPATKNGNVYITIAATSNYTDGRMASGTYADVRVGIDGLSRDMQVAVFALKRRLPKLPYTRKGIGMIAAEMKASLLRFVANGFLSNEAGSEPIVLPPQFELISSTDKSKRKLKAMKFTAVAQGAIQSVQIQGTITF